MSWGHLPLERSREWGRDDQERLILDGSVDLAYLPRPIDERGLRLLPLFGEARVAMLPADHRLAGKPELTVSDLSGETWLRYFDPGPDDVPIRTVEEKFERVAAGSGITLVPTSIAEQYSRPDIACVPVPDAEPDQVFLAWEAGRRSSLITAFAHLAQEQA